MTDALGDWIRSSPWLTFWVLATLAASIGTIGRGRRCRYKKPKDEKGKP